LPPEIVYCNHCGVSTPNSKRGRAVELCNIESDDEEVSLDEGEVFGYTVGFITLAAIAFGGLIFFALLMPETRPEEVVRL
jgi:hypothetical protein